MKQKSFPLRLVCIAAAVILVAMGAAEFFSLAASIPRRIAASFTGLSETEQVISDYAEDHGLSLWDYPQELVALLERNPETEDYVLRYPLEKDRQHHIDLSEYTREEVPLFLQWDSRWGYMKYGDGLAGCTACGPVCLSMAAYYLTGDDTYAPDKMITYAQLGDYYSWGSGTSWTLFSEGAVELGFDVTELPLVEGIILDHLEQGHPVICAMGPGDFTSTGHFIVLTGTENGLLRVNDPNSRKNSEKLWDYGDIQSQIRNLWAIDDCE